MPSRRRKHGRPGIETRVAELAALREATGRAPIRRFVAALRDPALPAAKTAAMGLCDRKAIAGPLADLLGDDDPNLRWRACALAWFFNVPDFEPRLIGALRDPDRMVRTEAAWAMRWAHTDAAVAALRRAMGDPERIVAHYAAWVLRRNIRPQHPDLRALAGLRIPELPLRPRRAGRPKPPAGDVGDDAAAFERFACQADAPVYRAALVRAPGGSGPAFGSVARATLGHIDGYPAGPLRKTDFRVVCSVGALHFQIRCAFRGRGELAARCTEHGQAVHTDNSVEIFLDPTGRGRAPYFQICLNTRNARCEALVRAPGHTWRPAGRDDAPPWRPAGIRSSVRTEKGFWVAEVAVPFADLGLTPARMNKLWRMNVTRNAHLPEMHETTSWADMGDHDAHRPQRFGWLWVDAGGMVNADAGIFEAEPIPLSPRLTGWRVLSGRAGVRDGSLIAPPGGSVLRWNAPIPFEAFEVSAEAMVRHQVRLMFAPDAANADLSWMAAYINPINEINVAGLHRWDHWAPPYPGHLSIFKEVYPHITHSRWYGLTVRVRPERLQVLLDGAVHMECPNPTPGARHLAVGLLAGGRLRKLRVRPLGPA